MFVCKWYWYYNVYQIGSKGERWTHIALNKKKNVKYGFGDIFCRWDESHLNSLNLNKSINNLERKSDFGFDFLLLIKCLQFSFGEKLVERFSINIQITINCVFKQEGRAFEEIETTPFLTSFAIDLACRLNW